MTPRPLVAALILALAACSGGPAPDTVLATGGAVTRGDTTPAKQAFARFSQPFPGATAAFGSYAKGCLAGAVQLPETGPTWQAMRLSRNRNWGSPDLVAFLERYSAKVARIPGRNGIYVGDMSQPRGGPMISGHASHQIGLDADIWLNPVQRLNLSQSEREAISAINYQRSGGAYVNSDWTPGHMAMVKAAAEDPAVARIFIFAGAKVQMCKDATGNRDWLRKVRPWYGHNEHIHVRLKCPSAMKGCVDQAAPPPGDGCDEAETWVNGILNPPKPDPNAPKPKPPREMVMADLPAQCSALVAD
jgi:penicillin-insensitive murein endopeptidase